MRNCGQFKQLCVFLLGFVTWGCATATVDSSQWSGPSPYLLVFAGDGDGAHDDFLAVVDVRAESPTLGRVLATQPVGLRASMPHHMEYELPPAGELLFMNAHHHEQTLLVDTTEPLRPTVARRLTPPPPFRFTHDYKRPPNGNRLVGFLRSDGPSPKTGDSTLPGGHGGIAEYSPSGELIRTANAAVKDWSEPIRPYAFAPLLSDDLFVTTSAPMMEDASADVVQIWRYSDFKLLHTLPVPPGTRADGTPLPGAAKYPFEPRVIADGTVLLNAYGCGFYRLTNIADRPMLTNVYTIQVPDPPKPDTTRGACGVPVIVGNYWIMPVGRAHTIVSLDISDPGRPREVGRFDTSADFNPHWMAKDPASDRLVVGAEFGGEQGMLMLRIDRTSGHLAADDTIAAGNRRVGYIDLGVGEWPHGPTGPAWGHAALFLPAAQRGLASRER